MDVPQQKTRKFLNSYMSAFDHPTTLSAVQITSHSRPLVGCLLWNDRFTPHRKRLSKTGWMFVVWIWPSFRTTEDEIQLDSQSFNHPTTMPLSIWNPSIRTTLCSSFTDSIQILSGERNQKAESSINQSNNPQLALASFCRMN